MAIVNVTRIVNAPAEQVWQLWDDFANVSAFHPALRASYLINDSQPTGMGAQRQCDMADGKNFLRERIVGYTPGRQIVVDIYETSMPLKSARATITVEPSGKGKTRVNMQMQFEPSMGLLGKMMLPMMKPKFTGLLKNLLQSNAELVEGNVSGAVPA